MQNIFLKSISKTQIIESLNWEIRCTHVVRNSLDGHAALMLVCARLRHVISTQST